MELVVLTLSQDSFERMLDGFTRNIDNDDVTSTFNSV
jgi:hypothetical protein